MLLVMQVSRFHHLPFLVGSGILFVYFTDTLVLSIPKSHIKPYSTRAVASSLADISGVSPKDLCDAVMWSNPNVFARFYRLDMASGKSISTHVLSAATGGAE